MRYLQNTGGEEGLVLHMLRDVESQTQVITWNTGGERKGWGDNGNPVIDLKLQMLHNQKPSDIRAADGTILREGHLALLQVQVASNGVVHGKLLQTGTSMMK